MTRTHAPADTGPGSRPDPTIDRGLALSTALAEANRCLMCWDAPCTRACPTSIDVPGFIKRIANRDDIGAARVILSANVLGDSCGHACPTTVLCEGACVMNDVDGRPIPIGKLQSFATAPVVHGGIHLFEKAPPTGQRVAVIGAGPAGLACAAELVRMGYEAVAFDSAASAGGLNSHGVAEYKVPRASAIAEVEWIESAGVEIQLGTRVGADIGFDDLVSDYDAVFVGVGLGNIRPLQIEGEDLDGVHDALDLIEAAKTGAAAADNLAGRSVIVLGGGNTAIDAARLAPRLGAERVTLVYRRGAEHMPAYAHEVEEARSEGVEFAYWLAPQAIEGDGRVEALQCERTAPGATGADGRPSVVHTGEEISLNCDVVIVATGQEKRAFFLEDTAAMELDGGGRVVVDDEYRTSNPSVWAGGDCVNGGKEVVNAVAEGMAAARSIDSTLSGRR